MQRRALVITNHMERFGGSEIVASEFAEEFLKHGFSVDIYANYIGSPMAEEVARLGISLRCGEPYPNPFDYDIVYSQHHVLPILLAGRAEQGIKRPYFVYSHLSSFEPFEKPGVFSERRLADQIYANSFETKTALLDCGLADSAITIFHNAAPEKFFRIEPRPTGPLEKLTVVSNHIPQELSDAIVLLREKGLTVSIYGTGGTSERITPDHIQDADAIVTIGKTTQYAIAAARPVYCYDVFGGPGWLTLENYKSSAERNYSGRCCGRKLTSEEIAEEITSGFWRSAQDIQQIRDICREPYSLEKLVERLLLNASAKEGRTVDFANSEFVGLLNTEKQISEIIRREYCTSENQSKHISYLNNERQHIERNHENNIQAKNVELEALNKQIEELNNQIKQLINSRSWKITAPLRKFSSLVSR